MSKTKFTVTSELQKLQSNLQTVVNVAYTKGKVTNPQTLIEGLANTLSCHSQRLEICLGKDTSLTLKELRDEELDLHEIKSTFCRLVPKELRELHIEGAVRAELEQITGVAPRHQYQ